MIGTGYVGLVSGACLAAFGHQVTCLDKDARRIAGLQRGEMPIFEPGLAELVSDAKALGQLSFAIDVESAVKDATVVFVAVGTPPMPSDGSADLSAVFSVAEQVAKLAAPSTVLVIKSTVPVGTGDKVEQLIKDIAPNSRVSVVSNPEFLREGSAIADFMKPDRVVIGTENVNARRIMLDVYKPLVENNVPVVMTQRRTSELIKYAANSFLAMKIAFINEMADLCETVAADISDLSFGIGLDTRIGASFLNAGPGYGGSCFPKDTLALLKTARDSGVALKIVEQAVASNRSRKANMAAKVAVAMDNEVDGKIIAVLGLAFKANTDDMRESPSLPIIAALQDMGATVRAYDPVAMKNAARVTRDVKFCATALECARGADAVVIVTEWNEFKALDLASLRAAMKGHVLVDLRNVVDASTARHHGLVLTSIGRFSNADGPSYIQSSLGDSRSRDTSSAKHIIKGE